MKLGWLKAVGHVAMQGVHAAEAVANNPIGAALLGALPAGGVAVKALNAIHGVEDTATAVAGSDKAGAAYAGFKVAEGLVGDVADDALVKSAVDKLSTAYVTAQNAAIAAMQAAKALEAVVADARLRHAA